jgi:threonine synthase
VAQAAMIGNPVSMPRVVHLAQRYDAVAGCRRTFVAGVTEQQIMDWQLAANRNGHVACTHGGECLAGLLIAKARGWVNETETAVLDSTAHALKFSGFQDLYFSGTFPEEFEIVPDEALINRPVTVQPKDLEKVPAPGRPLQGADFQRFVDLTSREIARCLDLKEI